MSYTALKLDGNGYASIADASQAGLDMGLSDFMIEGCIKADPTGSGYQRIISKRNYYFFRLTTAGYLNGYIHDDVAPASCNGVTDLRDGKWHYVVFLVDRSSATGLKLYLDGFQDGTSGDPTGVTESLDNIYPYSIGVYLLTLSEKFVGLLDEVRVWNFGFGGLPVDWATYVPWRATGRNVFKDISEYNGGSWNLYADAERTDKHDGSGTVAGLVVGMKYEYVTATPHTLDYQGGTLDDDGVFTATHTTGTIASGDADDHVRRAGLVARYRFEGNYTDETSNSNDLTAGGTGNIFLGYALKKNKIIAPAWVR